MQEVDDFIAELSGDEKRIVSRLRLLIVETDPRIRQKLSYGVPYFFHHRRICFLWPASHLPRNEFRPSEIDFKVTFGFCYGNLLSNDQGLLLKEGRKQVYVIKYSSIKEINENAVREILQEAIMIDEEFKPKKKTR